jgi:cytochrome bd-type quinol oxidase subunit 1
MAKSHVVVAAAVAATAIAASAKALKVWKARNWPKAKPQSRASPWPQPKARP